MIKQILRNIRLKINRIGSKKRCQQLKLLKPTIISNNCWAGIIYEYLGLPFYSPTIGLYFFSEEYIKFLKKLDYYLDQELTFIPNKESKYYSELIKMKHEKAIIGKLDDIEIVFLHYKSEEEAKEKWSKRVKRINKNCLIVKFCNQNLCEDKHIKEFDQLPFKNKLCFTSREYPELNSVITFKNQIGKKEVKRDYYAVHKYLDLVEYIKNCDKENNSDK